MSDNKEPLGLSLLRKPFDLNHISKLPKPTKRQTEIVRNDFKAGIRCSVCGGWHHPDVVHLDYVGHAALTDRLLDCDPKWNWEPLAFDQSGAPLVDKIGGMWIKLTVCGQSRLGYGHAEGKSGGDAVKEVIGDALRNAAMRFGAALDLWHKGDLHSDDDAGSSAANYQSKPTWKTVGKITCKSACNKELKILSGYLAECEDPDQVEALIKDDFKDCIAASEMNGYFWETEGDVVGLKDRLDQARIRVTGEAA